MVERRCWAPASALQWGVCLPLALSLGCAGGAQEKGAGAAPQAESDRGHQCLADAAVRRSPPADADGRIWVSHILVRHADLERPQGATRSPEEACLQALSALQALEQGRSWDDVSSEMSDAKNGDLGEVRPEDLDPAFAGAAFSLEPGELSYVVESSRGFHVILRRR